MMAGMTRALDRITWPIHTERLLLRPGVAADAEATWQIRSIESVSHWITQAALDHDQYVGRFRFPPALDLTIVIEHDGMVIGDLMLRLTDPWAQAEVRHLAEDKQAVLGWCLHPDAGGKGYATEAVRALLAACFEQLGVRRVSAECFAGNTSSWHLMERVGMRREFHGVKDSLHRSGEWMDSYAYAILAEEWQQSGPVGD